jgi:hypothetical protein
MADRHCTSLDEAIREGNLSPWLAVPFALGWIVYASIAIPVALLADYFSPNRHLAARADAARRAAAN